MINNDSKNSADSLTVKKTTRREFIKNSAWAFGAISLSSITVGCGGGGPNTVSEFPVLVFSDIHFNPFDDTSLFTTLNAADPSAWAGIFQTSTNPPSPWNDDTNYASLVLALSSISQNLGTSPFVIYTGDLLGHYFSVHFKKCNGNVEDIPGMETFADKTVAFVTAQIRAAVGNLPVMFALGNSDSYGGLVPEPSFLSQTVGSFYNQFLNGTTAQPAFLSSFKAGGYYSTQPAGTNLMVIGLNTVPFAYAETASEVSPELAWLDSSLASAQAQGKKVWLLMHIPPGAVLGTTATTAGNVASNGHITSATMMWQPGLYEKFILVLAKYPGLVALTLGAHTHMSEYRILSADIVLEITPSITPKFGNNPAFKIFTISSDTLRPTDYRIMNYDLASMPVQFNSYYKFSVAYSMQGFLDVSLYNLFPELHTNNVKQSIYRGYYYSGSSVSGNAVIPISNTIWPIYWSGIGKMVEQEFIDSVNAY
ncbi:metallophosphoesterase [Propionivibrio sp.]|uniref:metallophosphoesterase n=1 Tax=Propionivibrio sp. TaxID=2212460 RepID=UPI003BF0024F